MRPASKSSTCLHNTSKEQVGFVLLTGLPLDLNLREERRFEMASSFALLALLVAAFAVTAIEARAVPDPMPLVMDMFGSPLMIVRDKRASNINPYAQRAMLFTGFYRPTRRSPASGQAGGIYAQGNSVGGGAYFGQPQYLREEGPEPADEPEIVSADAEASPAAPEHDEEVEQQEPAQHSQHEQEPVQHSQHEQEHEQHDSQEHEQHDSQEQHKEEHEESNDQPQDNSESEAEKPASNPEAVEPQQPPHKTPSKSHSKAGKKMPMPAAAAEDDEEEYDDEEDDEPLASPVMPSKGNKGRRNKYPSLNNYFPMVFTFPRGVGRRGSSSSGADSIPGMITAIANSYSTGKGGVASSVARAYGGTPTKKQRRTSQQSTK